MKSDDWLELDLPASVSTCRANHGQLFLGLALDLPSISPEQEKLEQVP